MARQHLVHLGGVSQIVGMHSLNGRTSRVHPVASPFRLREHLVKVRDRPHDAGQRNPLQAVIMPAYVDDNPDCEPEDAALRDMQTTGRHV